MNARGLGILAAATLLGLPALSSAQGLGDVAARAREEREKKAPADEKAEVRSFSNNDLEGLSEKTNEGSTGTVSTPVASGAASPERSGRSSTRTLQQTRAAQERAAEARVNQARARVQALEARVDGLQQRLNPMSTTYVYGGAGGPVGGRQSDEEQRVRQQLTATEQQLEQARQALSAAEAPGGTPERPLPADEPRDRP